VPTNPLAKRPAALQGWRYVFAPQASPQGRQGAPLLEHCAEPPDLWRPDGAAARAVSGRDQRQPACLHGARQSKRSTRGSRPAWSRCSTRIARRHCWIAMWCTSGSTACGCAGPGNGADVGWRVICGSNLSWMSSGRRDCPRHDRASAGWGTRWLGHALAGARAGWGTRWLNVLKTLVTYRLIDPGSEWRLHRQWYE
jgi:hypothetical protein